MSDRTKADERGTRGDQPTGTHEGITRNENRAAAGLTYDLALRHLGAPHLLQAAGDDDVVVEVEQTLHLRE